MDIQPGNILVVDDNTANLQMLSTILKERGHKVRAVTSGQMALIVARTAAPELILLDVNMPDMNGYQVCELLKADSQLRLIPVIFISALDETLDKVAAFQIGGVDYITKPFQVEEVVIRVENHLKMYRLYQQAQELAALEERQRIARDLHDAVSQTLFSASMIAETLIMIHDEQPEKIKPGLDRIYRLAQGALAEMRTLLIELRPESLVSAELGELLEHLTNSLIGRTKADVTLTVDPHIDMDVDVKVAFYRIAQEALNNIVKHARASRVSIELKQDDERVCLRISDNGRGFDLDQRSGGHFGLGIMQERAQLVEATFNVLSEVGHGTSLLVEWQGARYD